MSGKTFIDKSKDFHKITHCKTNQEYTEQTIRLDDIIGLPSFFSMFKDVKT